MNYRICIPLDGFNKIIYLLGFYMTKQRNFGFDTFCNWGLATTHNLKEWIYTYTIKVITRSTLDALL